MIVFRALFILISINLAFSQQDGCEECYLCIRPARDYECLTNTTNPPFHQYTAPHETFCELYYDCYKGIAFLCECLGGRQYNPETSACDLNYDCELDPVTEKPITDPNFECSGIPGYFPDSKDCKSFYECLPPNGIASKKRTCLEDFLFNDDISNCDWKELVDCKNRDTSKGSKLSSISFFIISFVFLINLYIQNKV